MSEGAGMRRAKLIEEALRIIGTPPPGKGKYLRLTIEFFLKDAERPSRPTFTSTTRQKKAAQKLAQALRRLVQALKSPDLADDVWFDPIDHHISEEEMRKFISGVRPLDGIDFGTLRRRAEAAAYKKLGQPKPRQLAKRLAAQRAAWLLLTVHGPPLAVTRKGRFDRLAATLYGHPNVSLFEHCRAVKGPQMRAHYWVESLDWNQERNCHTSSPDSRPSLPRRNGSRLTSAKKKGNRYEA